MRCLQTLTKAFKGEESWLLLSANVALTPEAGKFANPSPLTSGKMRCLVKSSSLRSQFSGFSWFRCSWQLLLFLVRMTVEMSAGFYGRRGQQEKLDKKVGEDLTHLFNHSGQS